MSSLDKPIVVDFSPDLESSGMWRLPLPERKLAEAFYLIDDEKVAMMQLEVARSVVSIETDTDGNVTYKCKLSYRYREVKS